MLEKMTDLQFVLYVLAGISAVVLLQKIIVSLIYRHLKKETDGLPTVNDRWMKQLKLKYENTYKINSHMADTRLYVDRQVEKLKFFHAHLAGMNLFYRKAQLICILLGGTSYALAVRAGRTVADCHLFFVMGILAAVFLQLLDCLSGNERSEKIVKQNITDYFVNILEPKLVEPEAFAGTQVFGSAGYRGERFADVQPQRGAENGRSAGEGYAGGVTDKRVAESTGDQELRNREMLSDMQQKEETGSMAREKTAAARASGRWQSLKPSYGNGWEDFPEENAFAAAGSISNVDGQVFSAGEKDLAAGGQCVSREEEDKIVREVLKEFLA